MRPIDRRIDDAVVAWKMLHDAHERPGELYLGEADYEELHHLAEIRSGHSFSRIPYTEEERMEYQGMRVYRHQSNAIRIE